MPILCFVSLFTACVGDSSGDGARPQIPKQASVDGYMPATVRAAFRRSCASCHGINGHGIRSVAPDFYSSKHRSAQQWEAYLRSPIINTHPSSFPPPLWLNDDEIKDFALYLSRINQGE